MQTARTPAQKKMPPVNPAAEYLVDAFVRLGMIASSGMSAGPLPYAEIAAGAEWSDQSERDTIRDMSRAYLEGRVIGQDPFGIPPYQGT